MRKSLLAVALACSVSLTGCALGAAAGAINAAGQIAEAISAKGETVVVRGTQGLIVGELAYNGAARLALDATERGQITGATATKVRALNAEATALLRAGFAAKTDAEKAIVGAQLMAKATELKALIPAL